MKLINILIISSKIIVSKTIPLSIKVMMIIFLFKHRRNEVWSGFVPLLMEIEQVLSFSHYTSRQPTLTPLDHCTVTVTTADWTTLTIIVQLALVSRLTFCVGGFVVVVISGSQCVFCAEEEVTVSSGAQDDPWLVCCVLHWLHYGNQMLSKLWRSKPNMWRSDACMTLFHSNTLSLWSSNDL